MVPYLIKEIAGCLVLLLSLGGTSVAQPLHEKATFAGGCFWCMQPPFEKLKGVIKVSAGYTGGTGKDPTYGDYARKGYLEAVEITYDPSHISFPDLLHVFWRQIDPTDPGGQFVDRGPEYRSAIFFHTEEQKQQAERSKAELEKSRRFHRPLKTEILPASTFYQAEEGHQDFSKKHPDRYESYRTHSGRDQYLDKVWGRDRSK